MEVCVKCDIAFESIACPLCEAQDTISEFEVKINELEEELRAK